MIRPAFVWLVLLASIGLTTFSCAYYNTYYLARKYYNQATGGRPYVVRKQGQTAQNFNRSIDYSKKVISHYPDSKWVDDAYLLWARALLGTEDPGQTVNMLQEFPASFPESPLLAESKFYLGVAYLQMREYDEAVFAFDEFLDTAPRHKLAPNAHLEKSRALMALDRPSDAAEAANVILFEFEKQSKQSNINTEAREARAEARLESGEYDLALDDYRNLGVVARSDEQRFEYLLREADCHEGARRYDEALALLRDALAHERPPFVSDTLRGQPARVQQTSGYDRYGRLLIRTGTVHLLAGRHEEALAEYERVVDNYPLAPLAGEAYYRRGYIFETVAEDFEAASVAYGEVQRHAGSSAFGRQAQDRLGNLDRLKQFHAAGGDTTQKKAEEGFLLAEIYLFQQDKPQRALEQYRAIETEFEGAPSAAKAINAQAWVLREKLERPAEAETLLWRVVRDYPATEAQIDARDYLERAGHDVPTDLIVYPEPPPPDTTAIREQTPAPQIATPVDTTGTALQSAIRSGLFRPANPSFTRAQRESLATLNARNPRGAFGIADSTGRGVPLPGSTGGHIDSVFTPQMVTPPPDTSRVLPGASPPDTARITPAVASPPDTTRMMSPVASPPDSSAAAGAPRDTTGGGSNDRPAAADSAGADR